MYLGTIMYTHFSKAPAIIFAVRVQVSSRLCQFSGGATLPTPRTTNGFDQGYDSMLLKLQTRLAEVEHRSRSEFWNAKLHILYM